jgi:hypothetical protein
MRSMSAAARRQYPSDHPRNLCEIRPGPGPRPLRVACEIPTLHVTIEAAIVTDVERALLLTNDEQHPRAASFLFERFNLENRSRLLLCEPVSTWRIFRSTLPRAALGVSLALSKTLASAAGLASRSDVDHSRRFGRVTTISRRASTADMTDALVPEAGTIALSIGCD